MKWHNLVKTRGLDLSSSKPSHNHTGFSANALLQEKGLNPFCMSQRTQFDYMEMQTKEICDKVLQGRGTLHERTVCASRLTHNKKSEGLAGVSELGLCSREHF